MNLANETPFPFRTTRDYPSAELVRLTAVTTVVCQMGGEAELARAHDVEASWVEACVLSSRVSRGYVEVIVLGEIAAPNREPFRERQARLVVGAAHRRVLAFGPRRWLRSSTGTLTPSAPLSTSAVELSWSYAFGGTVRYPAGFLPGTRLPGPSTVVAWPQNPGGSGFFPSEAEAEGQPLPQLEDPNHLMRRWDDRPTPACWSPLPADSSLRLDHFELQGGRLATKGRPGRSPLVDASAVAPPALRFDAIEPGARVELEGFGDESLSMTVPPPPFHWRLTVGDRRRYRSPTLAMVALLPKERRAIAFYRTEMSLPLVRHLQREACQVGHAHGSTYVEPR